MPIASTLTRRRVGALPGPLAVAIAASLSACAVLWFASRIAPAETLT